MDELVFKSKKGTPVTNSLLVSEKFGKRHVEVLDAIRELLAKVENSTFVNNQEISQMFALTYQDVPMPIGGGFKKTPVFVMNRDGFTLLVMGFTGEEALQFKLEYIDAFNKMEAIIKKQGIALPSYAEALRALADKVEENEALKAKAAQDSPKIEYFEKTIEADHLVDIGQSAKLLKLPYGRNTFFKLLRDKGVLFKGRNEPKQEYCERGYFQLKNELIERNSHPSFMITKVLVTQKGLYWLSKMFGGDYNPNFPSLNIQ